MEFKAEIRVVKPLNIRDGGPYLSQTIARRVIPGGNLRTAERVTGEKFKGNAIWYREEGTGFYFWSGATEIVRQLDDTLIAQGGALLSTHFSLAELITSQTAIRKGIDNTPSTEALENLHRLAQSLETVRDLLGGVPIHISSAYRCPTLNQAIGGSQTSFHCKGLAADFVAPQFGTPLEVATAIRDYGLLYDQLIHEYGRWVHLGLPDDGMTPRREELSFFGNGYIVGLRSA